MNASDAMALSDTSCVSINEYPGALPVNLVRVELRPDGNLVYSDAAARAIGSLYLDNISYHLNRSENRSGMRSANDKLLEPKTFNLKPLEDVRVEEFSMLHLMGTPSPLLVPLQIPRMLLDRTRKHDDVLESQLRHQC